MDILEVSLYKSTPPYHIQISVQNMLDKPICIQSNQLMLEGGIITGNRFSVIDKETGESIVYQGIMVKALAQYTMLEAGEIIKSLPLDLKSSYSLEEGKNYEVYYGAMLPYYEDACFGRISGSLGISSNAIDID